MKKIILFLLLLASINICFAQETDKTTETVKASKGGISEIPASKRPKPVDKEKAEKAAEKDESEKDYDNKSNTIKYGVPSEISTLIDELIKNDDPRFTEEIYDVFQVSKNTTIKQKVLTYFKQLEDPCLEDYAVEVLNDPYEEKNDLENTCPGMRRGHAGRMRQRWHPGGGKHAGKCCGR